MTSGGLITEQISFENMLETLSSQGLWANLLFLHRAHLVSTITYQFFPRTHLLSMDCVPGPVQDVVAPKINNVFLSGRSHSHKEDG